jgi:hypothetical protein
MKFQITDTKKLDKNTLRGSFALTAGQLKIEGFTFHVKNGKSWIGFPSRQYIDQESGETKYYPIIHIEDKDRYWKFQDWCKDQLADVFDPPESEPQSPAGESSKIPF